MAYDFSALKKNLKESEDWLGRELSGVRTGRATPNLLDGVRPEAYDTRTPLRELASISVEDARTLRIIPWDRALTKPIEKAIVEANLGVGVGVDDQGVRVSFPELTAERRSQLVKLAKDKTEQARVTLRAHRLEALKELETLKKEGGMGDDEILRIKGEIQKLVDSETSVLATMLEKKETEIAH